MSARNGHQSADNIISSITATLQIGYLYKRTSATGYSFSNIAPSTTFHIKRAAINTPWSGLSNLCKRFRTFILFTH